MTTDNPRGIAKPPRLLPGNLQCLPTLPWTFTWPMSAEERLRLTNACIYRNYPIPPCEATSYPYKANWQFRDHTSDDRVASCYVDLRGGPMNVYNVAEKMPGGNQIDPRFLAKAKPCCQQDMPKEEPPKWFYQ